MSAGGCHLPPSFNLPPINKFKPILTVQSTYNTQIRLHRLFLPSLTVLLLLSRMPLAGSLESRIHLPAKQESITETVRLRSNGSMAPIRGWFLQSHISFLSLKIPCQMVPRRFNGMMADILMNTFSLLKPPQNSRKQLLYREKLASQTILRSLLTSMGQ